MDDVSDADLEDEADNIQLATAHSAGDIDANTATLSPLIALPMFAAYWHQPPDWYEAGLFDRDAAVRLLATAVSKFVRHVQVNIRGEPHYEYLQSPSVLSTDVPCQSDNQSTNVPTSVEFEDLVLRFGMCFFEKPNDPPKGTPIEYLLELKIVVFERRCGDYLVDGRLDLLRAASPETFQTHDRFARIAALDHMNRSRLAYRIVRPNGTFLDPVCVGHYTTDEFDTQLHALITDSPFFANAVNIMVATFTELPFLSTVPLSLRRLENATSNFLSTLQSTLRASS